MIGIEELKLNLGCRTSRIPGFLNVDVDEGPFPEKDRLPDIVADASNLSTIGNDSVAEIYASNILEHFPHTRTQEVLREWNRVLKPGGVLWISVPDFDVMVKMYLKTKNLTKWMINMIWGDQYHKYAFHYVLFTWPNLMKELNDAGFSKMTKSRNLPYGVSDGSTLVDTWEGESVVINAKAVK